jgi:hypothetical protein
MIDFAALCRRYNVPVIEDSGHHHATRGWVQTPCPFCDPNASGYHLGYSKDSGALHCWRCDKLDLWDTLAVFTGISDQEKLKGIYAEYATERGNAGFQKELKKVRQKMIQPPSGICTTLRWFYGNCEDPDAKNNSTISPYHVRYLGSRNFNHWQLVEEWGIGATAQLGGEWAWRVIIPIRSRDGQTIAYQGRAISPGVKPKYKATDRDLWLEPPEQVLYGIDKIKGDSVIVVEGCPGVWRFGPGAVATLGIGWHQEQADILRHFRNRFICFDPEEKAQRRAEELAEALSIYPGNTEVLSGFKTDPGEFTDEEAIKIKRELGVIS